MFVKIKRQVLGRAFWLLFFFGFFTLIHDKQNCFQLVFLTETI